jgi:hypothetical protein
LKGLFSGDSAKQLLDAVVMDEEYRRELQGIADAIGAPMEELLMGNYYYELSDVTENLPEEWRMVATRSCTGIVAQHANGTVMMGRNQDYPPPFSPLQYDGTFVKNGKVIFEGTSFAGTVGMGGPCMVPGKWSGEINARGANKPSLAEAIKSAAAGDPSFPGLLRRGCERGGDFEDALKFLSDTPLILGGYITMAGAKPGEGAIITRNTTAEGTDVFRLKDGYPADKPFYLIQTNDDHWKDPSDGRRNTGKCLMENIGPENVDLDALWGVMSDKGKGECKGGGIYNAATIHTELIVPATGEYHTYLRHNIIEDVVV